MAHVWFLLLVLIKIVYGYNNIGNCDECIRDGGTWCNQIGSDHCTLSLDDNWCPDHQEKLPTISSKKPGKILDLSYVEKQLYIDIPSRLEINYNSLVKLAVNHTIVNSTETSGNENIEIGVFETKCSGSKCTVTIEAKPNTEFCSKTSGVSEFVYVKVTIGNLSEETIVKYGVSCACPCSSKVEKKSKICYGKGDLVCGACSCYTGWSGEFCDLNIDYPIKDIEHTTKRCLVERNSAICNNNGDMICGKCHCQSGWSGDFCEHLNCPDRRGDMQCTNPNKNDVYCSGNGYCGPCDTCVCYDDREGSQYFDEEYYCADLCLISSECDSCLLNNTLGECTECNHNMNRLAYNESLVGMKDGMDKKVWVKCNETIVNCPVTYYAMKNELGQINVMIVEHCNIHAEEQVGSTKVPIIFGVLALLACVAAIAGVVVWKYMNAVQPLPVCDPEYQNIDAEDCTGENPLYKSPMSSFKNPTYGKW